MTEPSIDKAATAWIMQNAHAIEARIAEVIDSSPETDHIEAVGIVMSEFLRAAFVAGSTHREQG